MSDQATYLSRKQAAEYLRRNNCPISHLTLANLAKNNNSGRGPSFYKDGNRALYDPADLDEWRMKRRRRIE